jgi:hypothetical protein
MRQAKARKCSPVRMAGSRSQSRARRRQRLIQAKLRSTTHRLGSKTKPRLASGVLTTTSSMPWVRALAAGSGAV